MNLNAPISGFPVAQRGCTKRKPLSEEMVTRWIKLFHEKEGRYPNTTDKTVWDKDATCVWIVVNDSWNAIRLSLEHGSRGLHKLRGSSLNRFKDQHGLNDNLTEEILLARIKLFHEKTGKYPSRLSSPVWEIDDTGACVVVANDTWRKINDAMKYGMRGTHNFEGFSLPNFIKRQIDKRALMPKIPAQRRRRGTQTPSSESRGSSPYPL